MKRLHARTKFSPIVAIIVLVALLISYCPAFAVPASPEIHTLSQADGSTFEAKKWGDEWLHGWETLDGYTILLDETSGNWVYATLSEDGQLAATGVPVSDARATEALPDLQPHIRPLATQPLFERTLPTTGTLNLPVLLVNFSDTTTTQTAAQFKSLLFDVNPAIATGPGSFRDYYTEVSYGAVTMSAGPAGVRGWYTASHGHDYYGDNDASGYDLHPAELVREAVQAADADVNFANYDNDNDGKVDVVVIIHQGTGEESSHNDSDIWSHRSSLSDAGVGTLTLDGKKIDDYVIQPETQNGHITTIGVFAHEVGHAFGLPDLYDTDDSSNGIGHWGLMGAGNWNQQTNSGDSPAHMTAWSKATLHWLTPHEVTSPLDNETISAVETNQDVYQLRKNPGGYDWITNSLLRSGEYFLVENRQRTGFDIGLPGQGLLVWHIDESRGSNSNEARRLVDLEERDNSESSTNEAADPFASCDNCFMEIGAPNSDLYSGSHSEVNITNVSASSSAMTADLMPQQIVFVVDDTGSMYDEINDVKATINSKIDAFSTTPESEHYTVITFKDDVTTVGQTSNAATTKSWINNLVADGGGDCPEASLEALQRAAEIAPTSDAWLMTDASPHGSALDLAATIATLVANRVKVYPIVLDWCYVAADASAASAANGQQCQTISAPTTDSLLGSAAPYSDMAQDSGGHMFHVSSPEVAEATSIILSEMEANADLAVYRDGVNGNVREYLVNSDGTMGSVNFLVNCPESTSVDMTVYRPNGTVAQPGDADVTYHSLDRSEYYEIRSPQIGVWKIEIAGVGTYAFSSSAPSTVDFDYLSDTNMQPNQTYLLKALLTGPNLSNVQFSVAKEDGSIEYPISLRDDGSGSDDVANDDVYSGQFTPPVAGEFHLKVTGLSNGISFVRVDTLLIAVETKKLYLPMVIRSHITPPGFDSQFNGSATGWEAHSGTWWIDNGSWYTSQGVYEAWGSASYAQDFENFEYEAMLWRSGCSTCANNILIRGTPYPLASDNLWYSDYLFEYTTDGSFSVWKRTGSTPVYLQAWTDTWAINTGDAWNLLKVVASGPNLYFYINGVLVWSGSDYSLSSGRAGFSFYRDNSAGNQIWVDWAKLSQSTAAAITDTVAPEQQLLNDEANQRGGGVPEYTRGK